MAVLDYALHTGDADRLKTLSDSGCVGCNNLVKAVQTASLAKQTVQDADITVVSVASPALADGETVTDLRFRRAAGAVVDADGQTVKSIKVQGDQDVQLRVRLQQGKWIVLGYRNVSST